jgi:SAM-dependent methyltransferase
MTWDDLDWAELDLLRERFLNSAASTGSYWSTPATLASYDFTYAERIGWKWDHVLRELRLRGWRPGARTVLDWGCGSGIAARRVIEFFGPANFDALTVWDHSALACDFAAEKAREAFPRLNVAQATPGFLASDEPLGLLVVSHVLNELPADALASLRGLVARADTVLWVEPGTHAVSRQLGTIRDELRGIFRVVAPCTHELGCPMFAAGNERHWCHFFAPPPSEIFADSNWVKFGQRAGIDLRSLPYAFVVLDRSPPPSPAAVASPAPLSRVIGRVEHFKPYARFLNCDATGLAELEVPKRAAPALYKELERTKAPLVYRWQRDGDIVTGGERLAGPALD